MPRGNGPVTKVHYKGNTDDFIVYVESEEDLKAWKGDRSIPLAQVVDSFQIMVTHKHGAQGHMDTASKASLENEFGTHKEDDCIVQILEKGDMQHVSVRSSFFVHLSCRFRFQCEKTSSALGLETNDITTQASEKSGDRNDTKGARQAH